MESIVPIELKETVTDFSERFSLSSDDVIKQLNAEHGWQNKYRRIMLLGKTLPVLTEELKQDRYLVEGCESQVWLCHYWHNETLKLAASSDAKIVKGLISIVLAAYNNQTREYVQQFDINAYLDELGLIEQLSPSRGNGVKAIIDAIRAF